MSEIRVAHRELIDNLTGLNDFGKERAAAALFAADADHNMRVDHAELVAAFRAIYADPQLNSADTDLVANEVQGAFTRLGSPAHCEHGVPHERLIDSLNELNTFGKQRAASALFVADQNADLCVTHGELGNAIRAVSADPQLNSADIDLVGNSIQLAYTRLARPTAHHGFTMRPAQK